SSGARQAFAQHDEFSVLINVEDIFDANSDFLFRNVNAGFESKDHSFTENRSRVAGVMHIEPDVMSQTMDKVFAKRLAVKIFAVRINIIFGYFVEGIRIRSGGKL